MTQFMGVGRTNYVHVENLSGLIQSIEPFSAIKLSQGKNETYCFIASDPTSGDFPKEGVDDDGNPIVFTWENNVMPYIAESDILVVMLAGGEMGIGEVRNVTGYSCAFRRQNGKVNSVAINLDDIYQLAQTYFNTNNINSAQN